jgi:hypothetical protein
MSMGTTEFQYRGEQAKKHRSRGGRKTSRLQSSIADPSRQDEIVSAGGRRDGVVDRFLGSLSWRVCGTGLVEIHTIQRLFVPRVKELAGVGALRNGAGTLAKLDSIDAVQAALAKML